MAFFRTYRFIIAVATVAWTFQASATPTVSPFSKHAMVKPLVRSSGRAAMFDIGIKNFFRTHKESLDHAGLSTYDGFMDAVDRVLEHFSRLERRYTSKARKAVSKSNPDMVKYPSQDILDYAIDCKKWSKAQANLDGYDKSSTKENKIRYKYAQHVIDANRHQSAHYDAGSDQTLRRKPSDDLVGAALFAAYDLNNHEKLEQQQRQYSAGWRSDVIDRIANQIQRTLSGKEDERLFKKDFFDPPSEKSGPLKPVQYPVTIQRQRR